MFTSNNQWILVGLTSFGDGCARPAYSGVYTRVAAYESWIKSNTNGSYWPVPLSHANMMQTSIWSLILFVVFILIC
jgi:secreted trypsin-like serine protease